MTLGRSGFVWRIDPEYKKELLRCLANNFGLILLPAFSKFAFVRASRPVTTKMLCDALDTVQCKTVRISIYGIKAPISTFDDISSEMHEEAENNTWDLGLEYDAHGICLVGPRYSLGANSNHTATSYSMLGPLGQGLGSAHFKITIEGEEFPVKIYPKLVHALKGNKGNLIKYRPDNVKTLRLRKTTLESMIELMEKAPTHHMYGLRIEVTVRAPTLEEAVEKASSLPFLNIEEYLQPVHPDFADLKIRQKTISKDEYLNQIKDLFEHANITLQIFRGRDSNKTTKKQQKICLDLFNLLGWNPGCFRISQWNDPESWWDIGLLPPQEEDEDDQDHNPAPMEIDEESEDGGDPQPFHPIPPPPQDLHLPSPSPEPEVSLEDKIKALSKDQLKKLFDLKKYDFICTEEQWG
ncbi:hypothetical protein OC844_008035 [Tilletia horrida]|nr:hypothetical protein OC844_008035 [Tilletia horrida]